MVLRLVYISTSRRPLGAADCAQILDSSRRNNGNRSITGLLVIGGNRCLQMLEGPERLVRERFEAIRRDERHFAVVVLEDRMVEQRQCPDWAMGFVAGGDPGDSDDLEQVVARLTAPIDDASLKAQFAGFAALRKTAA